MPCETRTRDKIIMLVDKKAGKSKMYFYNPRELSIVKVEIDGCKINSGKRCDFLIIDHFEIEYFVELKGKDVPHACDQISETIPQISKDIKKLKHSFVVSSACPLTTTELQKYKVLFKKKFNSTLTVKTNKCEHKFE